MDVLRAVGAASPGGDEGKTPKAAKKRCPWHQERTPNKDRIASPKKENERYLKVVETMPLVLENDTRGQQKCSWHQGRLDIVTVVSRTIRDVSPKGNE